MITDGHMQYLFDEKGKRYALKEGFFRFRRRRRRRFVRPRLMKLPFPSTLSSFLQQLRYLDAFAGIVTVSVGHCHPRVLKAIREQQVRKLSFFLFFLFLFSSLNVVVLLRS